MSKTKTELFTYEFITPSDAITFKAPNDKIAFIVGLQLGGGKAGVNKEGSEDNIPCMLMFSKDPDKEIQDFMGMDPKQFIEDNKLAIADAYDSFAYTTINERFTYDKACEGLTGEELMKFKKEHEDRNRSSMNKWVQAAWSNAKSYRK